MEFKWIFTIIVFCTYCKSAKSQTQIKSVDKNDVVVDMNFMRQSTEPPATRMTCLEWDTKLESDINAMPRCAPPTDPGTLYDLSEIPQTYLEIFALWQREFLDYHFTDDTCETGKSCSQFKTMMNEQANYFACAQFSCSTFEGAPNPKPAYYVTVCKFDQPTPLFQPYIPSGYFVQGCNQTSCNHWPAKTQCYNNFICCNPEPITRQLSTQSVVTVKPSTHSVTTVKTVNRVPFAAPTIQHLDEEEIVTEMNYMRQFAEPPAKRITCLDWNRSFEAEIKAMPSCSSPADPAAIYNVNEDPITYIEIFTMWQREYLDYHFVDDTCDVGKSCSQFKTMMNEYVNSFACVQFICPKFNGLPNPKISYYVTVCKFDQTTPSKAPYTPSGYYVQGCNDTSCNWPSKTQCYNNFICCNPGQSEPLLETATSVVTSNLGKSTNAQLLVTDNGAVTESSTTKNFSNKTSIANIVTEMNFHRQFTEPPAKRITCLEWDGNLENDIKNMDRCKPPTDTSTIYIINEQPQTYLEVFTLWQRGFLDYHFIDNTCEPGKSCSEFKTMMNEHANYFACLQYTCDKFSGQPDPSVAYYVTVCKFDQPIPAKLPYEPSGYFVQGCNGTSCNYWPSKTQCYNNFICCNPAPIATTAPVSEISPAVVHIRHPFQETIIAVDEIVIEMNYLRQFTEPPAKRITCLDWSNDLEKDVNAMPTCTPPTDSSTIYNIDQNPQTYLEIFTHWQRGFLNYHFTDNTCETGQSCKEFKTMMNEQTNFFACIQYTCQQFPGLPDPSIAYYVTVCKFDQPIPAGIPYKPSGYFVQGCNATSCNWPSKTQCYNNFICCGPVLPATTIEASSPVEIPSIVARPANAASSTNGSSLQITCLAYDSWYASIVQTIALSCNDQVQAGPYSKTLARSDSSGDNNFPSASDDKRVAEHHKWDGQPCKNLCYQLKSVTLMNERATMFSCPKPACQSIVHWKIVWKTKVKNTYLHSNNSLFEMEMDSAM